MEAMPKKEGIQDLGAVIEPNGTIRKYPLSLGRAKTLQELSAGYAFFTPAILYLHAGFTDEPLIDFVVANPYAKFYYRKFNRPIFGGLHTRSGDKDWNHVLWALDQFHWSAFADFLVSVTLTYRQDKAIAGVGQQDFSIADPLAVDNHSVYHFALGEIPITVFGLNGSTKRLAMVRKNPLAVPTLKVFPPDKRMVRYAKALYTDRNPVNAAQQDEVPDYIPKEIHDDEDSTGNHK